MNNKRYGDQIEDQKRRRALAQESADQRAAEKQARGRVEDNPKVVTKEMAAALTRLTGVGSTTNRSGPSQRNTVDDLLSSLLSFERVDDLWHVSSFANWVYRCDGRKDRSTEEKKVNADSEKDIDVSRKEDWLNRKRESYIEAQASLGWKLFYKHFGEETGEPLQISALGSAEHDWMLGKPDLIFARDNKSKFLIVEIKATSAPIPEDGWWNLKAQLWAYAQADILENAKRVELRAEIYNPRKASEPPKLVKYEFDDLNSDVSRLFDRYKKQAGG